jgi:GntR family transcriptional regulator/MocR family aminotransferase
VVPVSSAEAERELVRRALGRRLLLDGLARHHVGRARWFGIALGYAACSREELREALPVLVELVRTGTPTAGG